jgi:large subunit ribosomal protein L16
LEFLHLKYGFLKNKMAQRGFISNGLKYKKFNKQLKRLGGCASNNFSVSSESFIFKLSGGSALSPNQLESARRVIRRQLNRDVVMRAYVSCDLPRTSKSSGIRMGKGKGNVDHWVSYLPAGKLLFSLNNSSYFQSINSLNKASKKFGKKKKVFYNRFIQDRLLGDILE